MTDTLIEKYSLDKALQKQSHKEFKSVAEQLQNWTIKKTYSTLGYGAAEVTLSGVDCNALSSKSMESRTVPALYFIGEVVYLTGRLGRYNYQWAWSSGWCAGQ